MMDIELLPLEERKWACHHCGTTQSVKYRVTSNGASFHVCNKCVWLYQMHKARKEVIK